MAARVAAMFGMDPRTVLHATRADQGILAAAWSIAHDDLVERLKATAGSG